MVDAGDVAWAFAAPQPAVTYTPRVPDAHTVNAGDVAFTFAIPQPTIFTAGSHFVNAGDAAWAFAVPQPSTSGQTLSLSDFDDTGLDVETAALLLASAPGTSGQNFYVDVVQGWLCDWNSYRGRVGDRPRGNGY